ncbi:hypothetical protein HPB47_007860 [Ixodes persulcatus]|uniref:Uncharacterized protein n=1 Tax=Ixodes persulcatus TaxID=34615 RepID=A0AC60P6J6_IXOPE|nr:hypothetical protein HPB47_007860 [Ixodes persulcatus]
MLHQTGLHSGFHQYQQPTKLQRSSAIVVVASDICNDNVPQLDARAHHAVSSVASWATCKRGARETLGSREPLRRAPTAPQCSCLARKTRAEIDHGWVEKLVREYGKKRKHAILVGGDFNAEHEEWGYAKSSARGAELLRRATDMGLVLINEPGTKTRTAPSIKQQDTTPDLTWADPHTARKTEWRVFEDAWGSDHHPIETCIVGRAKRHKKHRTAKTTVWDDFRTILEGSTDTKLDDLTKLIRNAARAATVETLIEKEAPIPDTRLLSLWRKRTNHLRRYRRTRKTTGYSQG